MQTSDLKAQNLSSRNAYNSICNPCPPSSASGGLRRGGRVQSAITNHLGLTFLAIILCVSCVGKAPVPYDSRPVYPQKTIAKLGYSIQVGAFANLDNAVRLSKALERRGLDAYYFVHKTGLYKVRFGNFSTKKAARKKAEAVRAAGIIDAYYLVSPKEYAVAKQRKRGSHFQTELPDSKAPRCRLKDSPPASPSRLLDYY